VGRTIDWAITAGTDGMSCSKKYGSRRNTIRCSRVVDAGALVGGRVFSKREAESIKKCGGIECPEVSDGGAVMGQQIGSSRI
jgi:hypothetical protein